MKALSGTILSLSLLIAPLTWAAKPQTIDYAQVTHVTPIYKVVEHRQPVQNCWNERVRESAPRRGYQASADARAVGTLVGGIVGGSIGHAVGRGDDNKRIGTVVGAVMGAAIGNEVAHTAHMQQVRYRNVERCEVQQQVQKQRVIDGYDVTYRYHGQQYHTRTRNHPGKRIKVALTVRPLEH
ncbi:glycine zipper 2TM domain-containing protein [Teredinibacter turnerae]|uniref:glycine zipper 2TM domain-containing protein n=1 Tax=Teredinibacter turnerae TaxID=2426 RepID=UPI00037FDB5F|nr:glycine zipper 2TM domain-containing protein [Teredinibacter turnerae]